MSFGRTISNTSRMSAIFITRSDGVVVVSDGDAFTSTSHGLSWASMMMS